jgi:hypothetical protein
LLEPRSDRCPGAPGAQAAPGRTRLPTRGTGHHGVKFHNYSRLRSASWLQRPLDLPNSIRRLDQMLQDCCTGKGEFLAKRDKRATFSR